MRTFVTGDTHGGHSLNKISKKNWLLSRKLTEEDILIIAGDFGVIWKNIQDREEQYWLNFLNERPFITCVVDGNHENHKRLQQLSRRIWNGGVVGEISNKVLHLRRGEIYNINNKKYFIMGGASSVDKIYRQMDVTWWEEELPNYKEQEYALANLDKHNWEVDYIITHTAPVDVVKYLLPDAEKEDSLTHFFQYLSEKVSFKKWYFGHLHQDKDFLKYHALYHRILEIKD